MGYDDVTADGVWAYVFNQIDLTTWEITDPNDCLTTEMFPGLVEEDFPQLYPWVMVSSASDVQLWERNPYYHYWLGEAALEDDRPSAAKHHFHEAIERKPNEAQFYFMLAKTYFRLQDAPRALETIERIGEIAMDDDEQNFFASELATLITEE